MVYPEIATAWASGRSGSTVTILPFRSTRSAGWGAQAATSSRIPNASVRDAFIDASGRCGLPAAGRRRSVFGGPSVRGRSLEQRLERHRLAPLLRAHAVGRLTGTVHGHARILALRVEREEPDVEVRVTAGIEQPLLNGVGPNP